MTYYEEWLKKSEDTSNEGEFNNFVEHYYETEQHAYDTIFSNYGDIDLKGTAAELAEKLGYEKYEMMYFLGFLEGVNPSLNNELDLNSIDDDTEIELDINYEKLLYNMHEAQAPWLFKLESWENVFDKDKIEEIGKNYRRDHIAVSHKVGRNEPCPCGSGKKYKKCHGKNA